MTPAETGQMWLTLHEAANAFDVSLSTLHRRRRDGTLEDVGAFKDTDRQWKIPRQGLARLGFREVIPPVSPGQTTVDEALSEIEDEQVSVTPHGRVSDESEVSRLREQLAEAQRRETEALHQVEVWEARAMERDRVIEAQRMAMRLLEAAPVQRENSEEPKQQSATGVSSGPPISRRWWKFGLGR